MIRPEANCFVLPKRAEQKLYAFSLVGFGGDPRICIGLAFAQMAMKVATALLLCKYAWQLLPDQDLSLNLVPTLWPRSGLVVKLTQR